MPGVLSIQEFRTGPGESVCFKLTFFFKTIPETYSLPSGPRGLPPWLLLAPRPHRGPPCARKPFCVVQGWGPVTLMVGGLLSTGPSTTSPTFHPSEPFSSHQRAPRRCKPVILGGWLGGGGGSLIFWISTCTPQPPYTLPANPLHTDLLAGGPAISVLYILAPVWALVPPTCPEALWL